MFGFMRGGAPPISIVKATPKVFVGVSPVNCFSMNQYLIACRRSKAVFLLDCGDVDAQRWIDFVKTELPKLDEKHKDTVPSSSSSPSSSASYEIKGILQTHLHCDHQAGLGVTQDALPQGPETPLFIHEADMVWHTDPFSLLPGGKQMFPGYKKFAAPKAFVKDGDTVRVGELAFEAIHVPGHTPGQVVFHCDEARIAFVGDLIFKDGGLGRTDFPHCDPRQMMASLSKTTAKLPDDTVLFSGHGDPTTMGAEKRINPALRPSAQ